MTAVTTILAEPTPDVSTTIENVYTVAANTLAAVNMIALCNHGSAQVVANIQLYPLGVVGNNIVLAKDVAIPAGRTYFYRGYRSLIATDELWVSSDTPTSVDCLVSGLEHSAATSKIVQGIRQDVPATLTALYTAPATNATINDVSVCNHGAAEVTFNMSYYPPPGTGAGDIVLYKDIVVPPDGIFQHTGAIGMLSTGKLMVSGSATTLDAIATGAKG